MGISVPDTGVGSGIVVIDARHGPSLPRYLSCSPEKLALFATDTFFCEAWEDAQAVVAAQLPEFLGRLAGIMLKPDAIAGRHLRTIINWLRANEFRIVAARRVRIDRHLTRTLWGYQWNIARRERKDVCDLLLPAADSLFLLAEGATGSTVPASLRLKTRKGPAEPGKRRPGQLRYQLGNHATLLNFIHTADEPADVIRELGICFDAHDRLQILAEAATGLDATDAACRLVDELERIVPARDLSLDTALHTLRQRIAQFPESADRGGGRASMRNLQALVEDVAAGRSRAWRDLFRLADEAGVPLDLWDQIVIGSHLIVMDDEQFLQLVPGVTEADWIARRVIEGDND